MSFLPLLLTFPFLVSSLYTLPIPQRSTQVARDNSTVSKDVIVQMFEWSWDRFVCSLDNSSDVYLAHFYTHSIAAECTSFLGPAGYGYVQGFYSRSLSKSFSLMRFILPLASPPQQHITGTEWYTDYQPVSYNLTSKRGDRTQFQKHVLCLFPHPYD